MIGTASRVGVLACALSLAGCVSGPDYTLPANAVAAAPAARRAFVSSHQPAYAQAELPDRWWQLYDDPRLDAYVSEALRANTDLRAADANLRRATAMVLQYRAEGSVSTDADASATLAHAGDIPRPPRHRRCMRSASTWPTHWIWQVASAAVSKLPAPMQRLSLQHVTVRVVVAAAVTRAYVGICSTNLTWRRRSVCSMRSAPRWTPPRAWRPAGAEPDSTSAGRARRSTAVRRRCRIWLPNGRRPCSRWRR